MTPARLRVRLREALPHLQPNDIAAIVAMVFDDHETDAEIAERRQALDRAVANARRAWRPPRRPRVEPVEDDELFNPE